jgi:uncharacterized small protein (DUF1192 family)
LKHAPPYPETTLRRDPVKELARLRARLIIASRRYSEWFDREMATRDEEGLIWLSVDAIEQRAALGIPKLEEEIEKLHEQLGKGDERI